MRLKNAERVQPSLLERLTDHEPDATREVREHRSSSARSLRQSVMRDLGWLLNAQGIASSQDVARYPGVAESVLNFGFSDLAGKSASNVDVARIERLMADAIRAFEPRILPGTLRVRAIADGRSERPAQRDCVHRRRRSSRASGAGAPLSAHGTRPRSGQGRRLGRDARVTQPARRCIEAIPGNATP